MLVRCRGRAVLAVTEHVRTRMPDAVAAMFGVSGNACGILSAHQATTVRDGLHVGAVRRAVNGRWTPRDWAVRR
jgi:hypothetical protein